MKLLYSLLFLIALAGVASADVQTVTTTGTQTLALNDSTTVVKFNASSQIDLIGMSCSGGCADGRTIQIINGGTGNVLVYADHTGASAAQYRIIIDANSGYRTMYGGGIGLATAVYNGTLQRWQFGTIEGFNVTGPSHIFSDLSVYNNLTVGGTVFGGNTTLNGTGTRLTLKADNSSSNGSNLRWRNYLSSTLWTMGPDFAGNASQHDWYLYDSVNGVTNLYIDNDDLSYLSFGTTYGGIQYNNDTKELGLFSNGSVGMRINQYGQPFMAANVYYTRSSSNESAPTLACDYAGSTMHADSNGARGIIYTGANVTGCAMHFNRPYDYINNTDGFPVCVASTNSLSRPVAITGIDDHNMTFSLGGSAGTSVEVYYHCDGIANPP